MSSQINWSKLICLILTIFITEECDAENWPGWRGPHRSGVTVDEGVSISWSASENILWKSPLPGTGISNPVVWEDRVFVTASEGRDQGELHVLCFSKETGAELWHQRLWGTAPTQFYYPKSGMASPTSITDGKHLWTFFGTGDVFCFSMNGELIWQRSLAHEYGAFENRFAASSSPLLFENSLVLQCDHYGASYLIALNRLSGANVWKSNRPDVWLSWSSPQLVPVDGRFELVVSGSERLDGYDPRSGVRLWTVRGMARECVPTPVLGQGMLFAVSGPNGAHIAVKPGGTGDVTGSHVVWRNERGTSFVPSGIVLGTRYYLADDKGIATCLDTTSGTILWRKRLGGNITASPVAAGNLVFFTNEAGSTLILDAAKPEYHEISRNEIGEDVYASLAISQGNILIRTAKNLVCVRRSHEIKSRNVR